MQMVLAVSEDVLRAYITVCIRTEEFGVAHEIVDQQANGNE